MRKKFGYLLLGLMFLEVLFIILLVGMMGLERLSLPDTIIASCVVGVFGQIAALVRIIVKSLFNEQNEGSTLKKMLDLILLEKFENRKTKE